MGLKPVCPLSVKLSSGRIETHPFRPVMEETLIQTNGIRLHVMQDGPKNDQLILLLHGFPEFW